jgi:hypothetical protein
MGIALEGLVKSIFIPSLHNVSLTLLLLSRPTTISSNLEIDGDDDVPEA